MRKSELNGWDKVFSFTFIQNYKNKAAVIGLVLVCLFILLAGPLMALASGTALADRVSEITDCKAENLYLKNDTAFEFDTDEFKKRYQGYEKINFIKTDDDAEVFTEKFMTSSLRDIYLNIHISSEDGKYHFSFMKAKDSEISSISLEMLSDSMREYFYDVRVSQTVLSEETRELIFADTSTDVAEFSEISDTEDESRFNPVEITGVIIYAFVIMMIVLISSQQIAVSLIVEKSSKVMETLLLSVRPLAIIAGKITGTMAVLVCNAVLFVVCGIISGLITASMTAEKFTEVMSSGASKVVTGDMSASADLMFTGNLDITPGRIIFGIFAIIFTTILAYVFYAVISGISGASCSSMDDLQSASAFISISTVLGVYLVMGAVMADKPVLTEIAYLFPFSGIYMIPVEYILGKASVSDLLILWAEIILLTVLLFRFAAGIYHVLVYHNGERLKLKNLIEIFRSRKGKV